MNERSLFLAALEKEPAERAAFLAEVCAGDAALRRRLEALVHSHEQASSFLERGPADLGGDGNCESWRAEDRATSAEVGAVPSQSGQFQDGPTTILGCCPSPPPVLLPSGPPRLSCLGEYDLLERLGGGGMGDVYRARHRRLDRLVALKVLARFREHTPELTARFLREMKALGAVEHPHLVEALDAGESEGVVFLAMKLVPGVDLCRLVKDQGPLPVAEACELARQAALGLAYLHGRGLVHRDLKPSNLMRTPEGVVKVLDLGLACFRDRDEGDLTGVGQVVGTPDYLAPEQGGNASQVDGRADLYSLGATLFFLLTAQAPFAHFKGVLQKLRAHAEEPPPEVRAQRPEVPEALAALIQSLLAKRPADRPESAAEVARRLAAFTADSSADLATSQAATPTRTRWPFWLGLAATLVLVAAGAWWRLPATPSDANGRPIEPVVEGAREAPLRVGRLDVRHFANLDRRFDRPTGVLGRNSFTARLNDSVELEAELARPAYAYLIAYRPDGVQELCFPENENEVPPRTARPRYPWKSRGVNYGLDEGTGLQAFVVVASSQPLPAYRAWRALVGSAPWGKYSSPPAVVWLDDGGPVEALTAEGVQRSPRGAGRRVAGKAELVRLTDWLRERPGVEAVTGIGFAVEGRD